MMKAWLKGGLIGGILSILLFFLSNQIYKLFTRMSLIFLFKILYFPRTIIYLIVYNKNFEGVFYKTVNMLPINSLSYELTIIGIVISLIFVLLFYFIIGAIIGLIIGKIKRKKGVVK
jgi:hypothetical protein